LKLSRVSLAIWICGIAVRSYLAFGAGDLDLMHPEPVKIAISLAQTGRFADPYAVPTGLTAHSPPIFPWILAPIYFFLGDTRTADLVRVALAIVVASASYAILPFAARALAIPVGAGILAGFVGALLPAHYWPESNGQFETPFAALFLILSVILWRPWRSPMFSGAWVGLGCLLSPVVLPPLAAIYTHTAWRDRKINGRQILRWTAVAGVAAGLTLLPWILRGRIALGGWFLVRDNFWLEVYNSNNDGALPDVEFNVMSARYQAEHPFCSPREAAKLRNGELAYMAERKRQVLDWIGSHPRRFAELCRGRLVNFWNPSQLRPLPLLLIWIFNATTAAGLFLLFRRQHPAFAALGAMIAAYTLPFLFIQNGMRYQHPIFWILLLLCGVVGHEVIGRIPSLTAIWRPTSPIRLGAITHPDPDPGP
jgi:hypothetical protein